MSNSCNTTTNGAHLSQCVPDILSAILPVYFMTHLRRCQAVYLSMPFAPEIRDTVQGIQHLTMHQRLNDYQLLKYNAKAPRCFLHRSRGSMFLKMEFGLQVGFLPPDP